MSSPVHRIWVVVKVIPPPEAGRAGNPFVRRDLKRFQQAGRAHERTLREVLAVLRKKGIPFQVTQRARGRKLHSNDLVLSVGGDGTFLEAARGVRGQRILGVNSNPAHSAGSFCAATAGTFESLLDRVLRGRAKTVSLNRIRIVRNGRPVDWQVLNDLLVTHRRPAAMSRYGLEIGRRREEQRSSGLWIATAAGSTGAIRSAGGRAMPRGSRDLQYRPRELYTAGGRKKGRLTGGMVPAGTSIRIYSLMRDGMICVDGEHLTLPFRTGDRLEIRPSATPLCRVAG